MLCPVATVKSLIIVLHLLLFVASIYEIDGGTKGLVEYNKYQGDKESNGLTKSFETINILIPLTLIMVVGLIQCLMSFVALIGAPYAKPKILKVYTIAACFQVWLHLGAAIVILVAANELKTIIAINKINWRNQGMDIDIDKSMQECGIVVIVLAWFEFNFVLAYSFLATRDTMITLDVTSKVGVELNPTP